MARCPVEKVLSRLNSDQMNSEKGQAEPLVSVCIPTYNRASKIERAIHALAESRYQNLEIIISDNASTDETPNVCRELCAFDSRIKYFRHAENMGPNKNYEFARAQANGKYFLWHGDDDYLGADYIAKCVGELERDESLVLVSGLAAYYSGDNRLTRYGNVIQADSDSPLFRVVKYLWLMGENSMFYGAYRVDRVRDCRLPNCLAGDYAWVADVLLRGKAKIVPGVYIYRDFEEDSMSSSISRTVAVIGAPRWNARFPWVAICKNVAGYLIFQSNGYKGMPLAMKIWGGVTVCSVLISRGLIANLHTLGGKVPVAKKIYRKYCSSD